MSHAPDLVRALRVALVWMLALIVAPVGNGPFELVREGEPCGAWCPCDDEADHGGDVHDGHDPDHGDDDHGDGDDDCDDDCDNACSGCCGARLAAAVANPVAIPASRLAPTVSLAAAPRDGPGCRLVTGVFRPPPALT